MAPNKYSIHIMKQTFTLHIHALLAFAVVLTAVNQLPAADNPALERFGDSITFYHDFSDPSLRANIAVGEATPSRVRGELQFLEGLYGRALLLGKDTDSVISYLLADNFDFTRPGTITFWVCPVDWDREQTGRRPLFDINAAGSSRLQFLRWGSMIGRNQDRLRDAFFLFVLNFPDMQAPYPRSGVSGLEDGMWHNVAITWDDEALSLYVDGVVAQRSEWSRPFEERDFPPDSALTIDFGGRGIDQTLLDAFTVYNRRLSDAEIREVFQLGIGIEFILNEQFASIPQDAVRGPVDGVSLVPGRLAGENAVLIEQGAALQWALEGDEPYFIEFWVKPEKWDGLSQKEEPVCRIRVGDIEYRLLKPAGESFLELQRANGEVVFRYPIYRWRQQAWMRRGDDAVLWHYIQIASTRGGLSLSIDGFQTQATTGGTVVGGALRALELNGRSGNIFSELRVVKGMLDYAALRARFRHLYQGLPLELLRVAIVDPDGGGDDMDFID